MIAASNTGGAARRGTARLFFALWPDEVMQAALANATAAIVAAAIASRGSADAARVGPSGARAVPAGNLHLTLAFLGAVPDSRLEALSSVAAQLAAAFTFSGGLCRELITVNLDHVEHWRRAQILCATSSQPSPSAAALAEALKRVLVAEGFTPDLKPFHAHATLARKVRRVTRDLQIASVCWTFRDFRLIESHTDPAGSIYSTREIWALDGARR